MENKSYIPLPSTNNSNNTTAILSVPFRISTTTSADHRRSTKPNSQPTVITNKLIRSTIKQEQFSPYPKVNPTNLLSSPTVVTPIHLNPRENLNRLSLLPMTNTSNHLMSTLNPAHLTDTSGTYFVTGLNDIASNFKLNPSSNTDIPSPSSSSNSSNPTSSSHHHHPHPHHPTRRHGEGSDPTRKREMRLQKNREAARECRRKKKEYIKCLEERVASLEAQNKALIEELRQLKELYCQREESNKKK